MRNSVADNKRLMPHASSFHAHTYLHARLLLDTFDDHCNGREVAQSAHVPRKIEEESSIWDEIRLPLYPTR